MLSASHLPPEVRIVVAAVLAAAADAVLVAHHIPKLFKSS
jgi:hypothetical protein